MSSWSGDSDNPVQFKMTGTSQWNAQITKIEQTHNTIRRLLESTNQNFQVVKHKHTDTKNLESAREKLGVLFRQMDKEITDLERIISVENNQNFKAQKLKIKQIRSQAAELTKRFRDLCTNINSELKNREMQRKKEISITSHEFDYNEEESCHNDQMTVSDSQLKELEEEQKQMEKINRDVILLEDMFIRLNTIIEEQGEKVDNIHSNVESAYENVDEGTKQLDQAVEYKKSALKKKLCIIGIIIAVLGILGLILGLSLGFSRS